MPDNGVSPLKDPIQMEIRPYRGDDADELVAAVRESLPELVPWLPWCHPDYARADAESWIEVTVMGARDHTLYDFVVLANGRFAGACGVNQIDAAARSANLGYWIRTSCAGSGLAPRAVRAVVDWTFANTDLARLEIVAAVENVRSQRVAEKSGALREGVFPERATRDGRPVAAVVYAVTRSSPTVDGRTQP
jgi:ribosomal-protein-serine acetyltransferase